MYYKNFINTLRVRGVIIVILSLGILAAVYSIYWYILSQNIKEGILYFLEDISEHGFTASYKEIEVNGFPNTIRIIITNPRLVAKSIKFSKFKVSWHWKGSGGIVTLKPWDLNTIRINLSGSHSISFNTPKDSYKFVGDFSHLTIFMEQFVDGLPKFGKILATDLNLRENSKNYKLTSRNISLVAQELVPDSISSKTPTLNVAFLAEDLSFDETWNFPLGDAVERFKIAFQVLGRLSSPFDIKALENWRDNGGVIDFESLEGNYGPLEIKSNGTIALDDKLQILAVFSARIRGILAAIRHLENTNAIKPLDAAIVKIMFNSLSQLSSVNGSTSVDLPLNIQNGELTVHQFKVLNIPLINWSNIGE